MVLISHRQVTEIGSDNYDMDFDLRKTYIRIYKNELENCTLVEIYFDNYVRDLAVANTLLYVNNVNIIPQPLTVRLLIYQILELQRRRSSRNISKTVTIDKAGTNKICTKEEIIDELIISYQYLKESVL